MSNFFGAEGCKFLDYDERKYPSCELSGLGDDRAVWERRDQDNKLQLCQFCTKRGRLNNPEACTSKSKAQCSDYVEHVHLIPCE